MAASCCCYAGSRPADLVAEALEVLADTGYSSCRCKCVGTFPGSTTVSPVPPSCLSQLGYLAVFGNDVALMFAHCAQEQLHLLIGCKCKGVGLGPFGLLWVLGFRGYA